METKPYTACYQTVKVTESVHIQRLTPLASVVINTEEVKCWYKINAATSQQHNIFLNFRCILLIRGASPKLEDILCLHIHTVVCSIPNINSMHTIVLHQSKHGNLMSIKGSSLQLRNWLFSRLYTHTSKIKIDCTLAPQFSKQTCLTIPEPSLNRTETKHDPYSI